MLAGEDDRSESGSPGPQRRTRKASSRVASRKASKGARGRSTPRYNEDDTGSEYETEGGAHEDEGSECEHDAADVEDVLDFQIFSAFLLHSYSQCKIYCKRAWRCMPSTHKLQATIEADRQVALHTSRE